MRLSFTTLENVELVEESTCAESSLSPSSFARSLSPCPRSLAVVGLVLGGICSKHLTNHFPDVPYDAYLFRHRVILKFLFVVKQSLSDEDLSLFVDSKRNITAQTHHIRRIPVHEREYFMFASR